MTQMITLLSQKTHSFFTRKQGLFVGLFLVAITLVILWLGLVTKTEANRQRGGFLNQDFRSQNPTTGNIIYALWGDGTTGSTAYTRNWSTNCSNIPTIVSHYHSGGYLGGALTPGYIYVLHSGNYIFYDSPQTYGNDCIVFIGEGDVTINKPIIINGGSEHIIIDNIKIANATTTAFQISNSKNISLNNVQAYSSAGYGLLANSNSSFIHISNSQFYNNFERGMLFDDNTSHSVINNSLAYNNTLGGLEFYSDANYNTINNSQFFNNGDAGVYILSEENLIHNNVSYNNTTYGLYIEPLSTTGINYINNFSAYNNNIGIYIDYCTGNLYGTIRSFGNTSNTGGAGTFDVNPGSSPVSSWNSAVSINTTDPGFNYDRVTNPQNGSNQWLLNPTLPSPPRGVKSFDVASRPIRYIFGLNILKQKTPVSYSATPIEYGNDLEDYDSNKYIAELDSTLPPAQQSIVNQYFGSGSVYTQNRLTNNCSLSAFQIVNLPPSISYAPQLLQDHTIYILTGGEYKLGLGQTEFFTFDGNCIAVIGNGNTIIKKVSPLSNMFYANNQHNLIIDSLKIDGLYPSSTTAIGINFDGTTNNSTINNTQVYNNTQYGIYFGMGSHHNTIINSQLFNNGIAGIHFYYSSNYNVINNTQTYNNTQYGIRFANGSVRNTMNNFQSYNNGVGVFGDMTTKENVINRAAIYNNSDAGIYFKNSSGNVLNDVRIYNNKIGIRTLYSSPNNNYHGELKLFNNRSGDFDGTNGNDGYLAPGAGLFPYPGTLTTGGTTMSCSYATNPTLSGNGLTLLTGSCNNAGYSLGFISSYNTNVQYTFGLNIYKQVEPVRYNTGFTLDPIPSQYDPNKYIAEVFPIRDIHPEGLSFSSTGNYELNTSYTTEVYTAQVINTIVTGYLSLLPTSASGHLIINGSNVGMTGTINNGDAIKVWLMSSTGFNQAITGTVTIGTVTSAPFTLTTRSPSELPTTGSFAFNSITGVNPDTWVNTNTVTISGIETGVLAGINFTPAASGRLEVYSGSTFVSSGTAGLLVFNGNKIKAIIKSSSQYDDMITGVVTIGLGTGSFYVLTTPDIYPPIISFLDDVTPGYRTDTINIYFSGANAISGYTFVNDPALCTSGMNTTALVAYTTGFVISGHSYNGKYLCAYAQDLGNNITTAISSTGLTIADVYFTDPVEVGPAAYDLISIGYANTSHNTYALIDSSTGCVAGVDLDAYAGSLLITTTDNNGQYVCTHAEDASGSGKYLISANPINIDPNMPSIYFTDEVSEEAVFEDTIAIAFSGGTFLHKLYKFVSSSSDCNSGGTVNYTSPITISSEGYNGKYFCIWADDSLGHQIIRTSPYPLNIDRTNPSIPIITYPLDDDEALFFTTFEFSASVDTGSGILGYNYEIAEDKHFLDIVDSDFVETTDSYFSPVDFEETDGKYYRRIQAVDNVGLTSSWSQTGAFSAIDNEDFFFNEITDANRDTDYDSDEITIDGLGSNSTVIATVDKGSIIKNGHDKGDSTTIENDDIISINLKSSKRYDTSVTSTLTIGNRHTDFIITTIPEEGNCNLSDDDKGKIQIVFNSLIGQYSGDQSKYDEFLATMNSMLQDQIDLTSNCNLQYLSDLFDGTIVGHVTVNTGNYIAPNCKEYRISYENDLFAYTSPDFRSSTYFANRDSLTRYIDTKNPGDCHISSSTSSASRYFSNNDPSKHIAPNGKVYRIQNYGNGYTSNDLSAVKYFSTLSELRSYLDKKNPPLQIWNHMVDTSFQPVIYEAPNSKSYTIYKTNRGYMSYKLLNVKYYSSLQEIENYINKNNPK